MYLEGLECEGDESSILECPREMEIGLTQCDHSKDAGIVCYGRQCYTHKAKTNCNHFG